MATKSKKSNSKNSGYNISIGKNKYNAGTLQGGFNAQQKVNTMGMQQQAQYNRPNTFNSFGSQQFTQNPDGSWNQTETLNPFEQQKLGQDRVRDIGLGDMAQALGNRAAQNYSNAYDISGIKNNPNDWDWQNNTNTIAQDFAGRQTANYESLNAKRFNQENDKLKSDLLNSGIPVGSEMYNNQMQALQDRQGRERLGFQSNALSEGFNNASNAFNMGQTARANSIGDYERVRDRPFQEMGQALSYRGGVNMPQFQARSDIGVPQMDVLGAQNQYEQQRLARIAASRSGRGGGGGGGGGGGYTPYMPPNMPSAPSSSQQFWGNALGGIMAGVGQGFGNWLSK